MVGIIVIGASAGGFKPLRRIVGALPIPCAAAIFVVLHIGPNRSNLPVLLDRAGMPAVFAQDEALIQVGHLYVAPPDHHMTLADGHIRLNQGPKIHYTRPAIDPLFRSAADAYGTDVMGIVLSGGGEDGAFGLRAIKERGGTALVQLPDEAGQPSMPHAALAADSPEALPIKEIVRRLSAFCRRRDPSL